MLKAIFRLGIALTFLCIFLESFQTAYAQIAPTTAATISGSVSDAVDKPAIDAQVVLDGPKHAITHTDAQGDFVFVGVPLGEYQLSAIAVGLGTATRSISVQGDVNIAIQYEPTSINGLKTIARVSGTANALFNITPASVTQVSPIQNAFQGKTSWRTILEQIPGVAQAGLEDGGSAYAVYPDGPLVPMQISINGALPYETATLLDDMPLIGGSRSTYAHAGSGTDLGVYPLNAFGTADVVRGPGASAPSIVDSIGGSFVLHAPDTVRENRSMLSLSTDPYGGIVANVLVAVHLNKLSATATYGVNDSPGPNNGANIPAYTTFDPLTVNGASFACTGLCAVTYLPNSHYANALYSNGYTNGLLICCVQVSSAWTQHSGSMALNYALSPSVNASIFYAGQSSTQSVPYADYPVVFTPPPGYTGSFAAGERTMSLAGFTLSPFPNQQTSNLLEEKITARIGSGLLRVSALQNRVTSSLEFNVPGATARQQLFGGGCVASTTTSSGCPAGYAAAVFNGGSYNVTYTPYDQYCLDGSNNRDLMFSYTTPLGENLRAGVSFVRSYYNIPYDLTYVLGTPYNFGGSSTTPSAISQSTDEFRVFVGGTPSNKTSLDLSMYFANAGYHVQNPNDSSGNTYVDKHYTYAAPRMGFVWRPTTAVAIRAAAGGGFAEAPLSDLIGSNGAITPSIPPGSYSQTLTNLNLQPEKSFGFDLGTDIRLRHDTVLSFDVYHTNLYGQLYDSTSETGTYLGLPLLTTQFGNLGESRYDGVLLDLRHDIPHGLYWALSGGLTRGYVVSLPAGFYNGFIQYTTIPCTNCTNITVVPGVNFNGTFTAVSVPYSQALGKLGYRWNEDKYIDLVGTYYGNNNTYFRPAFLELDGHVAYPLSRRISLLMTFRNITGIYDGTTQVYSFGNIIGVPTIAGLPYPEYGEMYGPRTVQLTTQVSL